MKSAKIIYFFLIIFSLFGCAQKISTYEKGYGLVAVPYNFKNQTNYLFLQTYEWKSSEDDKFSVKIGKKGYTNDVSLSELIPAGPYKVDNIVIRIVNEYNISSQYNKWEEKLDQPFAVYVREGSVMLIPFVYEVVQYKQGENIHFKYNFHEFVDDEKDFYIDKLKKKEGIDQWQIRIWEDDNNIIDEKGQREPQDTADIFNKVF